jgi:AmiR/NasT family two-component response regulator
MDSLFLQDLLHRAEIMFEENERLRILIADGNRKRISQVARAVTNLGHDAIVRKTELEALGELTSEELPDVTIAVVSESSEKSLELIGRMVKEASSPVIVVLDVEDPQFVKEAAKRGVFAYLVQEDLQRLQSSFDIVLRRFAEYHNLEGAFARRAVTEQAKGVLMERHGVDEDEAFSMLRAEARRAGRKVVAVADAVVTSRQLLPKLPAEL